MNEPRKLFVTADDRTGALEIGGIVANDDFSIPVGPHADDQNCSVVDIASRHIDAELATEKIIEIHQRKAIHRCHKMDSGLRGNWPHEVAGLVELGYQVAVVPSFPDAGRRCKDGTVYIQDVPVLESPFGMDPLTAPCSSKPIEVMEEADCVFNEVEIWDADNNDELGRTIAQCRAEHRVLVGPTGAIGRYSNTVFGLRKRSRRSVSHPILIICGSLNQVSRDQIAQIDAQRFKLTDEITRFESIGLISTPETSESISAESAKRMAETLANCASNARAFISTLFVIGGDTVAAVVGEETLEVVGDVDVGIPVSVYGSHLLVSKGGGIGKEFTVLNIVLPRQGSSDG